MGKKPVLGLVGLCVGLALSGCKNCGCGWASKNSRSDGDPPVAHVRKDGKTTTERSVAAKRGTPAQKKNPYDYPADSYSVKPPADEAAGEEAAEHAEKTSTRVTQPSSDPAGLKAGKGAEGGEEFAAPAEKKGTAKKEDVMAIPPPTPPMSSGLPMNQGVAHPVQPKDPLLPADLPQALI